MDESQAVYTGMKMSRIVDGEVQRMDQLKPEIARRIEMIGKLNDRWMACRTAGDGESMLKLAEEYAQKKMPVMAQMVRKEAAECQIAVGS